MFLFKNIETYKPKKKISDLAKVKSPIYSTHYYLAGKIPDSSTKSRFRRNLKGSDTSSVMHKK